MKVTVLVSGWFKRYTGGEEQLKLDVEPGTKAYDAASIAGIPRGEIGFVAVNGVKAGEEYVLNDNDTIKAFPLIIGG